MITASQLMKLLEKCNPDAAVWVFVVNGLSDELQLVEYLPTSGRVYLHYEKPDLTNTDYIPYTKIREIEIVKQENCFAETKYHTTRGDVF
jgi:hypothetical protein